MTPHGTVALRVGMDAGARDQHMGELETETDAKVQADAETQDRMFANASKRAVSAS